MKKGRERENGFTMPPQAFRLSFLDGTIDQPLPAGNYNIPPRSQPIEHVTAVALEIECQGCPPPRLDYLSFLFDVDSPLKPMDRIEQMFSIRFSSKISISSANGVGWCKHRGSSGTQYEYRKSDVSNGYRVRVTVGGEALSDLSTDSIVSALRELQHLPSFTCSRVDYNVDDCTGTLDLDTIANCLRNGEYAGYNVGEVIESYSLGEATFGRTVYFGGRKSLKRTRFYDKSVEAGLDYGLIRHETQLRGWRAHELCMLMIQKETDVPRILLGRLAGDMTFGIRHGKNLDRLKVAEFWTKWQIMLSVPPSKKPQMARKKSLDRTLAWLEKSVARAAALVQMISEGLPGGDYWARLAQKGRERIDEADIGNCVQWLRERECIPVAVV